MGANPNPNPNPKNEVPMNRPGTLTLRVIPGRRTLTLTKNPLPIMPMPLLSQGTSQVGKGFVILGFILPTPLKYGAEQ